ncbi:MULTISPECIES: FGGY-family carbohydrate kinase [unclassified Fusibacter]|uniref:FGGY-family carbohydrate kinase n=1 Tax=unclassified Fusibacter TaxID=2624464 RepID=UPI001012E3C3|nr:MULTISPECIES: FGGY-family carbohydrate kinase [unclassified Fusibacter]MCK8059137.1 FGGY-family carbohydrate kinase [Fusibacter sp. A2]NPE22546.1 carbohydrate kinase [Fusibacter sp. A1]RXV60648.1 carbohydrate kinase [Fusibacter sp. A1]
METNVISIDCGTQSVRALLFDEYGRMIHKTKREFEPYFSSKPGYAEQHPEVYFETICACLKEMSDQQPEKSAKVKGLCLTSLRDTGVFLNHKLDVVRPSMLWLDQRTAECKKPLNLKDRTMLRAVGMTRAIETTRKLCKVNWLKENEPENWDKTKHYVLLPAYLQYRLTGRLIDSIGNQIGHVPFNYKTQDWPKNENDYRYEVFGIERSKLYKFNKPGELVGELLESVAAMTGLSKNIKVISGASDKGCETLGVGCVSPKSVSLSFGTTATIQTTSKRYFEPLLFMPAYPAAIPDYYNPEVQVFRGYWMIRWFKQEFASREQHEALEMGIAPEELLNRCLQTVPAGSDGLILQPYWTPGLKHPDAKGSIIGFSDCHTRAHLYRAIIEGINYGLMDGLRKIQKKSKQSVKRIMVSGGGSQCDEICQITANMFNLPVYKGETYEAAGLGAAIIAFVGIGVYKDFETAVKHMVRHTKEFTPEKASAMLYKRIYERIYVNIFSSLNHLYADLNQILSDEGEKYEEEQ